GRTSVQSQNARIALEQQKIQMEKTQSTVSKDVMNAYATYQNALFVLRAQAQNLETARRNFDRTDEMYRQGQITSIEFRQAQLNQLNSDVNYSKAKYDAKLAELTLKQLTGTLF
ncbi:MAG: TolC family protein, partial [Flavobacteriales bacterium]|nr:TolC family protein [Flavobacteriales bacterium]